MKRLSQMREGVTRWL